VTYDGPKVTQYWTEIGICQNTGGGSNPSRVDPVIRHALAQAVNKSYIRENFYYGFADEGSTLIPPINEFWHYDVPESDLWKYDLSAAAALLEANGYRDTNGDGIREATIESPAAQHNLVPEGTPLTYEMLIRSEYPEEKEIALWLQTEWAQIGVGFTIKVVDEPTLNTIVYSYNYDLMIWYWSADIDPNYQLYVQTTQAINGWNDNMYSSAAYDENFTMAVTTMDREQRKVYVDNCQKVNYEDAAYILLAYVYQRYAWRDDTFTGWGDWASHPGRSMDNYWGANPLLFDLVPYRIDNGEPSDLALGVAPRARPLTDVLIEVKAKQSAGVALEFNVDFGDNESETRIGDGGTGWQTEEFTHTYLESGTYTITVTVSDGLHVLSDTKVIVIADSEPYSTTFLAIGCAVAFLACAAVVVVLWMRKGGRVLHDFHW
jgi:hypothetical protein